MAKSSKKHHKHSKTKETSGNQKEASDETMSAANSKQQHIIFQLKKNLEQELLEHNDFFDILVDMIPSKLYIAGQSGDDYNPSKKYYKTSGNETKETRKAQAKLSKRRKFNPEISETTVQAKSRMDLEEQGATETTATATGTDNKTVTPTTAAASEVVPPSPATAPASAKPPPAPPAPTPASTITTTTAGTTGKLSRIEQLQAKLHAKIAEKRGNRPVSSETVSKRAARRAEKMRRKTEQQQQKKKAAPSQIAHSNKTSYTLDTTSGAASMPPAAQDLQTIDYGNLSGLNPTSTKNYMETNKSLHNMTKGKNLQKLLSDAEMKRQKLEMLKSSRDKKHQEQVQNIHWSDTFQEADGKRIKDDVSKLKKAVKRKAAKKSKSQKAWKVRMEQQQVAQQQKQTIRKHNLNSRKVGGIVGANLSKKEVKTDANTNTAHRPGFEGRRKQDFLNGPNKNKKKGP